MNKVSKCAEINCSSLDNLCSLIHVENVKKSTDRKILVSRPIYRHIFTSNKKICCFLSILSFPDHLMGPTTQEIYKAEIDFISGSNYKQLLKYTVTNF